MRGNGNTTLPDYLSRKGQTVINSQAQKIREAFDRIGWNTRICELREYLRENGVEVSDQQISNVRAQSRKRIEEKGITLTENQSLFLEKGKKILDFLENELVQLRNLLQ